MCSRGVKEITWWKMERFHSQLSSVFQFKSGHDWAGRRACLGRKPVKKLLFFKILFFLLNLLQAIEYLERLAGPCNVQLSVWSDTQN